MKKTFLLCLLLAALPLGAVARSKHESSSRREFRLENRCPSTGAFESQTCPGWTIGYFTPLCAGGFETKENMYWTTVENARSMKATRGKHCKKLKGSAKARGPAY